MQRIKSVCYSLLSKIESQQNLKTFLLEMMTVRENFRDAEFAADVHRNAVGQTVAFVEARFIFKRLGVREHFS